MSLSFWMGHSESHTPLADFTNGVTRLLWHKHSRYVVVFVCRTAIGVEGEHVDCAFTRFWHARAQGGRMAVEGAELPD